MWWVVSDSKDITHTRSAITLQVQGSVLCCGESQRISKLSPTTGKRHTYGNGMFFHCWILINKHLLGEAWSKLLSCNREKKNGLTYNILGAKLVTEHREPWQGTKTWWKRSVCHMHSKASINDCSLFFLKQQASQTFREALWILILSVICVLSTSTRTSFHGKSAAFPALKMSPITVEPYWVHSYVNETFYFTKCASWSYHLTSEDTNLSTNRWVVKIKD